MDRTLRTLIAVLPVAAVWGCAEGLPAPVPQSVEPAWGWNGDSTPVVLRGRDFYPRFLASGADSLTLDRQFRAFLVGTHRQELSAVRFEGSDTLQAVVPAGVDPGLYDLEIVGPAGDIGRLRAAFTVTDSRADHIEVSASDLTWPVSSLARIDVQLLDPSGADVPEDAAVIVTLRGLDDPSSVHFEDTLQNQSLLLDLEDDLVGIRGRLDPTGHGFVTFTSLRPADLWMDVAPADRASVVAGATQFLSFVPAAATQIRIEPELPEGGLVAGAPFDLRVTLVDDFGNVATDATAGVALYETCGTATARYLGDAIFVGSVLIPGAAVYGATPEGGGDTCVENRIAAIGNVLGTAINGQSEPLAIAPGELDHYKGEAWPLDIVAGERPVFVRYVAEDPWGNRLLDHSASLQLSDSAGGLAWGPDAWACDAFAGGSADCVAWPVHAALSVAITATDEAGKAGSAVGLRVRPAAPESLVLEGPAGPVAAGTVFSLDLRAEDAFGNGVELDILGADLPQFTDGAGSIDCSHLSPVAPLGTERHACVATRAEVSKTLDAAIPSRGLIAAAAPFELHNGPLHHATVAVSPTVGLVAGDSVDVAVTALDAWNNPYLTQVVTSVALWDLAGDLQGRSLSLGRDGRGSLRVQLTTAATADWIEARSASQVLGRSSSFSVAAADAVGLEVEAERGWSWVDAPLAVEIRAVDAYGNTSPGFTSPVSLSSVAGAGPPVVVTPVSAGTATTDWVFDAPALQDQLNATGGGLTGSSAAIDAVAACANGPEADLTVGGSAELTLCRIAGLTPLTALSTAGSTMGAAAFSASWFSTAPDVWTRVSGTSTTTTWTDTGGRRLSALVIDSNGCADLAEATLWVADNDGEAAGPISLGLSSTELVAGSSTRGQAVLQVDAVDCAGDPAAGATVFLRTELGGLASGLTALNSTGGGLAAVLNSSGRANLLWSVRAETHAGSPTVHVGRNGTEAYGAIQATVTGDADLPVVLDVSPVGSTSVLFSSVDLLFSEPMLASTLNASTVSLLDPFGIEAATSTTLSADGRSLTVGLAATRDAGAGAWTLTVESTARDRAGNRLDGSFSRSASPFSLRFGSVADSAPSLTSCVASTSSFQPDGDPGVGVAADTLGLQAVAAAAPTWWELWVVDASGDDVLLWREAGSAASANLLWDGRDQQGAIVENGLYRLTITALDARWNAGASCTVDVAVANRVHPLE